MVWGGFSGFGFELMRFWHARVFGEIEAYTRAKAALGWRPSEFAASGIHPRTLDH